MNFSKIFHFSHPNDFFNFFQIDKSASNEIISEHFETVLVGYLTTFKIE